MERKFEIRKFNSEGSMANRIVLVVFSLIEALLGFRFVFKLAGANPTNVFVKGIYDVTQFIVGIFQGIFSNGTATGAETQAVFEPGTLIAIFVVSIVAMGVMKLMSQRTNSTTSEIKKTEVVNENQDHLS